MIIMSKRVFQIIREWKKNDNNENNRIKVCMKYTSLWIKPSFFPLVIPPQFHDNILVYEGEKNTHSDESERFKIEEKKHNVRDRFTPQDLTDRTRWQVDCLSVQVNARIIKERQVLFPVRRVSRWQAAAFSLDSTPSPHSHTSLAQPTTHVTLKAYKKLRHTHPKKSIEFL